MSESPNPWAKRQLPHIQGYRGETNRGIHGEIRVSERLKFPAPYFGGKAAIAPLVWSRIGDVANYVEPFAGSAAVLLARPHPPRVETVNDVNGGYTNAWRATDPEAGPPSGGAGVSRAEGGPSEQLPYLQVGWQKGTSGQGVHVNGPAEPSVFVPPTDFSPGLRGVGPDAVAAVMETINDLDPHVANVWRSLQADPEATAAAADRPVSELDMHAIHRWLVLGEGAAEFRERLRADPFYYCPLRAGWWLYGASAWIGGGWCATPESEAAPKVSEGRTYGGTGVHGDHGTARQRRKMPHQPDGGAGPGAHGRAEGGPAGQLPAIGRGGEGRGPGSGMKGVHADLPQGRSQLADAYSRGRGVHGDNHLSHEPSHKRPFLNGGGADAGTQYGQGIHAGNPAEIGTCAARRAWLVAWFSRLRDRLRTVRVCSGDFMRVIDSESVTVRLGVTGVFADPPYRIRQKGKKSRAGGLYATDAACTDDVNDRLLAWCKDRGGDRRMRICVATYEGDGYEELLSLGWDVVQYSSQGGYGNRNKENKNKDRERLFFSPHCESEPTLFDHLEDTPCP